MVDIFYSGLNGDKEFGVYLEKTVSSEQEAINFCSFRNLHVGKDTWPPKHYFWTNTDNNDIISV